MQKKSTKVAYLIACAVIVVLLVILGVTNHGAGFVGTFWSLLPPIVAIALALISKEVYSSLFFGCLVGALLYCNFAPWDTITTLIGDEYGIISVLADSYDMGILCFLVMLGIMVDLMNKGGGSEAFGRWATRRVKTRAGAQLLTMLLGVLIFIDDYFNCLTVGAVMRPVTESHKISRAKLAYIIDATAAPVCMIAPVSSWAAAVSGYVQSDSINGIEMFVKQIPWNYYCLLTLVMIVVISLLNIDYGPMLTHEYNAQVKNDLFTTEHRPFAGADDYEKPANGKSSVIDLLLPVVVLIAVCIVGLVYSGGINTETATVSAGQEIVLPAGTQVFTMADDTMNSGFTLTDDMTVVLSEDISAEAAAADFNGDALANDMTFTVPAQGEDEDGNAYYVTYTAPNATGYYLLADTDATVPAGTAAAYDKVDFVTAFSNADAGVALAIGSIIAMLFTFVYFWLRGAISFEKSMESVPAGFIQMISPILVLTFAWTLCSFTRYALDSQTFVINALAGAEALKKFLPAVIFLIGCFIGFATGTSWGTIGIMAPIVVSVFNYDVEPVLCTIGLAAACAGGVCGDHCSPISDTTIMASAGAHCYHLNHVFTQLPYAATVAAVSFVSFIIAGLLQQVWICLAIAIVLMIATLLVIKAITTSRHADMLAEIEDAKAATNNAQ
ncbi:MAG: hypothetical protein KBS74_00770 [Clostridiales bacterium]|nr:hypothetical protein [Candidatus Cacconaster stercorequi]